MIVNGIPQRTIWPDASNPSIIHIIDQRYLPHTFVTVPLRSSVETAMAIMEMWLRGAPLIGAAAAYGLSQAARECAENKDFVSLMQRASELFRNTRPTAVNLGWAIDRQNALLQAALTAGKSPLEIADLLLEGANAICTEDVAICDAIGEHGLNLIREISARKGGAAVQVLTHCNAGWVACIDWGTATAPIYKAHDLGIPVHVWVDETRPRNQGGRITAWELTQHGVPNTIVADNTGGHLMQHGMVDLVIVGTDRVTRNGDVANKVGTYLKALAAYDNSVPFYVALPSTTLDMSIRDGLKEIEIETRSESELHEIDGIDTRTGEHRTVRITPIGSRALNYGFDVTPARFVTGFITERGICDASEAGILGLFPEKV